MDDHPDWFAALADRYRIEEEIGRGGMACVYRAEDLRHPRKVAIKVLREDLAHAVALDRFQEEIRTAARLNHPNIVPLYDSGVLPAGAGRPALPWFAMMYVEGETLRDRLARGPLPVAEAVDLARAVAAGLDYAHEHGVIHRDIKPANILLAGDVPAVADFGIARALNRSRADDTLTAPGLAVGTAQYISPEQAAAERTVDHRTDVYALGCVVYEMLAGHPPFTGPSPQAIINRHNLDPPPPLATVRPSVPPATVAAVEKALAKQPADRWPSAGAFAHALRETTEHPARVGPSPAWRNRAWWTRRRLGVAAAAAAAAAVAVLVVWRVLVAGGRPGLDPDRYAIVSPQSTDGGRNDALMLRQALERWGGASVVIADPGGPAPPREADGESAIDPSAALQLAERLGAGRLVVPARATDGDSVLLRLALWDTRLGGEIGTVEGRVGVPSGVIPFPKLATLVDSLVLTQFGRARACSLPRVPASLAAVRTLRRGDSLMAEWRPGAAIDTFATAASMDPTLGPAFLCRALLMSWMETDELLWGSALVGLASGSASLGDRDQRVLEALAARQSGDHLGACAAWRGIAGRFPDDFVGHYGLTDCLVNDRAVVADQRSRTGWRFRAEYGEARTAFSRAVGLNPEVYRALAPGTTSAVRRLLSIQPSIVRVGQAVAPDTGSFTAKRSMEGDTLAYLPIRTLAFATADPAVAIPAWSEAAANARIHELLYGYIAAWRATRPREALALAVLSEALEVRGDRTAIDTLRLARRQATDPATAFEVAAAEVFLLIRLALPSDTGMLRTAAALADSLLQGMPLASAASYERAALAALRGRGGEAAADWRQPELTRRLEVPLYLKEIAPALQVYAAMGGPVDSLRNLERRVEAAIRRNFANADQLNERMRWLALPATIAWPQFSFATLETLRGRGDLIVDAVVATAAHDSAAVRRLLQPYWEARAYLGTQAVTLDGLRTEAELRWLAGERERAIEMLDDTLGSLFGLGPGGLQDPLQAAGLVRAAALRAEYAAARGDAVLARHWADVVGLLWADAEPASRDVVRRALALANAGGT
jgi:hypothetical protein